MTSASEASVAAQTATTPPGRHTTSSLKDLPMTQQPDPFSELRGLMAELAAYRARCIDARSWGGPTMYPAHPITEVRAGEMAKLLGALLDERDRLRAALTSILFLRPGGPCRNTLVEQMEIIARQALSQEIG